MISSTRRMTRLRTAAVVAAALAATTLGTAGTASADGDVTWTNDYSGCPLGASYNGVPNALCGTLRTSWHDTDVNPPLNQWTEASNNVYGCLHSQPGTANVIMATCDPNDINGLWNENWNPTNGHWQLINVGAGLALDGAPGPGSIPMFPNHLWLSHPNGLWDTYEYWH